MNINFTIGLNVLEFLCHFGAMVCYMVSAYFLYREIKTKHERAEYAECFVILLAIGIILTTIGANL